MIELLGQGYIKLVETWGSDESIIEAARMSVQGGFVSWKPYEKHPDGDFGLLSYLWNNKHHTPFEMAGAIIEVQAPIFVFREWHRHRTQSYNEASARYNPLPALDYIPTEERLSLKPFNKQSSSVNDSKSNSLTDKKFLSDLEIWQKRGEEIYQYGLENGVPKELARLAMSVGRFSKMRAQSNLRNWFNFLSLRSDLSAQWEIRQYADAQTTILSNVFPRSTSLFLSSKRNK